MRRPILDLVRDESSGVVFLGICDPGEPGGRIVSREQAAVECGAEAVSLVLELARRHDPTEWVLPAIVSTDRTRFQVLPSIAEASS